MPCGGRRHRIFMYTSLLTISLLCPKGSAYGESLEAGTSAASPTGTMIYTRLQAARHLPDDERAEVRRDILRALIYRTDIRQISAAPPPETDVQLRMSLPRVDELLDIIAEAESRPHGYDAVQVRAEIPPPKPPTQLTLAEIEEWIAATPRQQHAIGRYQIIPDTLAYLKVELDLSPDAVFGPDLQDRMALRLMEDAGLEDFLQGRMDHATFMDALAWIWAGLPLQSGLSAYHGYNGNRATITRETYESRFRRIFPSIVVARSVYGE